MALPAALLAADRWKAPDGTATEHAADIVFPAASKPTVAIASGAALANCSAESTEADDEVYGSEEDITGANNAMGLKLVYDEQSRRVVAQIDVVAERGEHGRVVVALAGRW